MIHNISRFIAALAIILLTAQTAGATETSTITVGSTDYTLFTGFTATGGNGTNYAKLVDGNTSTDWHATKNYDDPNAPANDFAGGTDDPAFVEFHADEPFIPKGYVLTCDHENAGFWKPVEWALKARLNESDTWTTIHSSNTTLGVGKTFEIACDNDGDNQYQYFRFEVYEVGATMNVDLDELQFYGLLPAYTHLTVKAATCMATGIKVDCYRRNSDGKYFTDNTGETEIPESDVIAPMIPHTGEHHEATDVNIEYWQCSMCGKYFSDSGYTTEITEEQTKIYRTITIDGSISGLVEVAFGRTQALAGANVLLRVMDDRIDISTLKVNDGAVEVIPDGGDWYKFTMPAADVTVTAEVAQSNVDGDILTGSIKHRVTITDGASITLNNAIISGSIVCEGSATITLVGTNSVSGATNKAGIQIGGSGTTLTIRGDGLLTVTGGDWGAGIGLSAVFNYDSNVSSGDIVIEGGTITTTGGKWGAGIGTGVVKNTNNNNSTSVQFGNITIKGGSVTAIGGDSGDGIGKGYAYSGPTITIGTVTICDGIDKVDASSIKNFGSVVYMHGETNVTASKTDYFAIGEDGNRKLIVQKPVIAEIADQTYTGSEITPEPTVTIGSLTLTKSTDYEYSYTNNTNVGTATVRATFQGDYASLGSVEKEFTIAPWSGSGIASDPFIIENPSQLLLLAHRVNGTNGETANTYEGMYFKLGADITFDHPAVETDDYAENYEAIGGYYNSTYRFFYGNFDGDGHTVSGIRIRKDGSGSAYNYQGLFGRIGSGADIHDVHLTDARITGCQNVGGIAGYTFGGYIMRCSVTDSYITATSNSNYGTICGSTIITDRLSNNYYHGCTVNGTENATNVGSCCDTDIADITANNGALPAYRLDLGANITTPPGTFAGQTGWLDTPPVGARLAPENGFTLAGNHYFASGYVFTPGSTLASGAAQGYTPRATLGDVLLDLYTHTGDAPDYTGTAIARLTITADCDGKTLASTEAIYSTREPVTVAYINADGTPGEASAIALDGTETSLAAGTYFAGLENVNFDHTLTLTGNVTLILADNCHMNVGTSGERINGKGIAHSGFPTLTITSEANGSGNGNGALNIYTTGSGNHGIITGAITINGGNVTADADGYIAVALYAADTDLTINGGTVSATVTGSGANAIYAYGNVNYNGGNVTATAAKFYAIYAVGNYTFSWRTPADRITIGATGLYAPDDDKTATFARLFTDAADPAAGNYYTGTLSDLSILAGKTLSATEEVTLAARQAPDGNYWTTFYCGSLPFDISGDACAYTATHAASKLTLAKLGTDGKTIPADCAVIIVGESDEVALTVNTDAPAPAAPDGNVLKGKDYDTPLASLGTGTFYVLGNQNAHFGFHRYEGETMAARKAYVKLDSSNARSLDIVFDDATGITTTNYTNDTNSAGAWYTVNGVKLSGKPAAKGMYINNGKKVVIK